MSDDIFSGKKIILGITGCIAAYKSAILLRELIKRGADVKVVMTPSATEFIAPLTLSTLSKHEVIINIFPQSQKNGTALSTWHIDYAVWADLMIIAPSTVNTIAKIAHGFADNALTTLVSALRCPLLIAPAADVDMYENKITQQNIYTLEENGIYIIHAEEGELASGLSGKGRFPEIDKIIDASELILSGYKKDLAAKKILVTAGPTYEDIDPVRFIGNRSSGKMGFEIAKSAFLRGANVTLISGPVREKIYPEINFIKVRSANEMKKEVEKELKGNEVLIMSAAVADYKPSTVSNKKIKKEDKLTSIKLTETSDILASIEKKDKIVVGFALETDNELKNASKKLISKNLDMIVLNSLKDMKSGFEVDTNKITIIKKTGKQIKFPLMSKFQAANKILTEIIKIKNQKIVF
ncbi:MAG: bifunctional phosphopantothenoylcysteine decarboxylase/phosphopantothenate--cysteine ligase CoaBC [Bacteroidetes bacterium]|nr:bifunctional phosphopantothenoylcysteine decarboxylase/phosphopantothenate--cysteine ligase CoaBC [Bacteroidota bacterium]